MKKTAAILALSLAFGTAPIYTASAADETFYAISNEYDLALAAKNPDLNYRLTCDINASVTIGTDSRPFTGIFDGCGYSITCTKPIFTVIGKTGVLENLRITAVSDGASSAAAYENRGTIRSCVTDTTEGAEITSGIVSINTGTIENCAVYADAQYAAALDNSGTIQNCYAASSIQASGSGGVSGYYRIDTDSEEASLSASYPGWDFENIWTTCGDRLAPLPISIIGKGTENEPYRIYDTKILSILGCGEKSRGTYFKQVSELEADGPRTGTENEPFLGIYDGCGILTNSALFGVIGSEGEVKNINAKTSLSPSGGCISNINNGTISSSYVYIINWFRDKDAVNSGGIAGVNRGTIEDSLVQTIQLESQMPLGTAVGGIAGINDGGTIRRCSFQGALENAKETIGGITGICAGGIIENCYSTGTATASGTEIGGIAGRLDGGMIKSSYSRTRVSGLSLYGGIVGNVVGERAIYDSYFIYSSLYEGLSGAGTDSVALDRIQNTSAYSARFYEGFDFNGTWVMNGNSAELISVNGNGTEKHPYRIYSKNDLVQKIENGCASSGHRPYYILLNDIDDRYISLGSKNDPFIGRINGNGFSMTANICLGDEGYIYDCGLNSASEKLDGTLENCFGKIYIDSGHGRIHGFIGSLSISDQASESPEAVNCCLTEDAIEITIRSFIDQTKDSLSPLDDYADEEIISAIFAENTYDTYPISVAANNNVFTDLYGHWAEDIIYALAEQGVVNGYDDGTFRPEDNITKGEFIKMMLEALGEEEDTAAMPYEDVTNSKMSGYISRAYTLGITQGINSSDTIFGIDDSITRLEAAVLIGRYFKPTGSPAAFTDTELIPSDLRGAVGAAAEFGVIHGMDDGSFSPYAELTRAEAAVISYRLNDIRLAIRSAQSAGEKDPYAFTKYM